MLITASAVAAYDAGYGYSTSDDLLGVAYNCRCSGICSFQKAYEAGKGLGHIGANVGS